MGVIVVDTSVLIDNLRADPDAVVALDRARDDRNQVVASVITKAELLAGMRAREPRTTYALWTSSTGWPSARRSPTSGRAARRYRTSHQGIGLPDYLIAATAEHLGASCGPATRATSRCSRTCGRPTDGRRHRGRRRGVRPDDGAAPGRGGPRRDRRRPRPSGGHHLCGGRRAVVPLPGAALRPGAGVVGDRLHRLRPPGGRPPRVRRPPRWGTELLRREPGDEWWAPAVPALAVTRTSRRATRRDGGSGARSSTWAGTCRGWPPRPRPRVSRWCLRPSRCATWPGWARSWSTAPASAPGTWSPIPPSPPSGARWW